MKSEKQKKATIGTVLKSIMLLEADERTMLFSALSAAISAQEADEKAREKAGNASE